MHIMVLNDGETFSDLAGCKIVWVDESLATDPGQIEELLKDLNRADALGLMEVVGDFGK